MNREAGNLMKFSRNFSGKKDVVFPQPYVNFTQREVLVESFHEGSTILDFIDYKDDKLQEKLAKIGIKMMLKMVGNRMKMKTVMTTILTMTTLRLLIIGVPRQFHSLRPTSRQHLGRDESRIDWRNASLALEVYRSRLQDNLSTPDHTRLWLGCVTGRPMSAES